MISSSRSNINICYCLKFPIPMCHRQFFRIFSQSPEYVKNYSKKINNTFQSPLSKTISINNTFQELSTVFIMSSILKTFPLTYTMFEVVDDNRFSQRSRKYSEKVAHGQNFLMIYNIPLKKKFIDLYHVCS